MGLGSVALSAWGIIFTPGVVVLVMSTPSFALSDEKTNADASPEAAANLSFAPNQPGLPDTVPANTRTEATVKVVNNATVVSPTDPDYCLNVVAGYATEVSGVINGDTLVKDTFCLQIQGEKKLTFSFPPLTPGEYTYSLVVLGKNSRRGNQTVTRTVEAVPEDDDGGSCQPPAGGCPSGETFSYKSCECVPAGNAAFWEQLSSNERMVMAGVGALAAYKIFSG